MCGGMKWIVVRRAENLSGEPDRRLMREMREEGGTQRLLQNRLGPALRYKEETLYLELGTIGDNSIIRQYFYRSIWVANLLEIKRRSCASDSSIWDFFLVRQVESPARKNSIVAEWATLKLVSYWLSLSKEYTEWHWPLSVVHSIMVVKSAQPGEYGVLAQPLSLYLTSQAKLWCTLQLRGQIARYTPTNSPLPLYVLCVLSIS